jgi:hypothetical protein
VKNQNFGENRDLLKFDLVCEIMRAGLEDRFVYVPMLTEDEERKEEPHICRHDAVGGVGNKDLLNFLDECVINEKRNVGQLEGFFQKCGINGSIYGKDEIFVHEDRRSYFMGLSKEQLTRSLILIDPDKGLDDEENDAGNLLYSDLRNLFVRMDEESILMFTQRFPDDMFNEYLGLVTEEIKDQIFGTQPLSLDDQDSMIFFITKSSSILSRLMQLLSNYTRQYAQKS